MIKQVSKKNMSLLFDKSLEEKKSLKSKLQLLIILFEITPFENCRMTLNLAELVVNFEPKQSAVALKSDVAPFFQEKKFSMENVL